MTDLLERAFAQASKLPPKEQDAIAQWLIEELKDESHWDQEFAGSQQVLSELASEALSEHRQGKTEELDPEEL